MTPKPATPEQAATTLDHYLADTASKLANQIDSLEEDIARIERLAPISEAAERARELARSAAELSDATARLQHIMATAGWGGLGAPVALSRAWLSKRRAHADYQEAERVKDEPAAMARRAELVANHNGYVHAERGRLEPLRSELAACRERHADILQFRSDSAAALAAAHSDGWAASDFAASFYALVAYARAGDLRSARAQLARLHFQRKPAQTAYAKWSQEAHLIRQSAYARYAGMAATGAYPDIAGRSITLAHSFLRPDVAEALLKCSHSADRWQVLSGALADPRHFRVDALWAVYWAMFQAAQSVEDVLSQSAEHEDPITGKLLAELNHWLSGWGAQHARGFGYPETTSYMGTLAIASKGEEARLGADIGIIVDLQIGDYQSRKVALFQAKKARQGITDIGSTSGQLAKLAARPDVGYYLFYHQSDWLVHAPAPTVCAAHELAEQVTSRGRRIDAGHLKMDVRTTGWDWASFVGFGLCDPGSGLGQAFNTPNDALDKLGGGNPGKLPTYLYMIAIADEPRVRALHREVLQYYRNLERPLDRTRQQTRRREQGKDGPELSL